LPDVESLAHQAIGVFGWLDTPIPTGIEQAWLVAASALLIAAVLAGTWRERAVMTGTLAGIVGATVAMQMVLITPFGYGMQTRYVMPYLVAAPILAGEILSTRTVDRRGQLIDRSLIFAGLVLVAIGQWSGFYTNARRNGVGLHSSASLLSQSSWKPPGGTLLWLVVAAIGCSCLALSGAVFRDESSIS
ncbi:MAG TPA: DUF2142 domain-containing protein, partial [Acidimicrobiales bacterium]|nr:DUF2142 domain-containing protein [Acidimicrobiales bacterium]